MKHRILLVSEFQKPSNNGWFYKKGFEKNGYDVIYFDPAIVDDPENKIFEIIKEYSPDLIIHTKNELPAETFQELRQFTKSGPVVSGSCDS